MLGLVATTVAFVPPVRAFHVAPARAHVTMDADSLYAAMNNMDSASMYYSSAATDAVAAVATAAVVETAEEDELCELINSPAASDMHQAYYTEEIAEEDNWWLCKGQELVENCMEVFYDGEMQVACAY